MRKSFFAPAALGLFVFAHLAGAPSSSAWAQGAASGCLFDRCEDKKPLPASPSAAPPASAQEASPAPDDRARPRGWFGGNRTAPRANRPQDSGFQAGPSGIAPGNFDFYVLSLSWSPSFCATRGSGRSSAQCETGAGLGFVVHGLWPQFESGFPQDCGGDTNPSQIAMAAARGVYPDLGLARYEWRKHGTCTGRSPADYFGDVRRARGLVTVPPELASASADQTLSPADIQRAFVSANPRLRPGMMAVGCQSGLMQEVRFCISKDLREFRACPQVVRGSCRAQSVQVPAAR